jgi:hypothetical protein
MDNKTEELNYNKVLVANSYVDRGRYTDSYKLILKIENEVQGDSYQVRKTMLKISEVYSKLGLNYRRNTINNDLKNGKWGECEKHLLEKIQPIEVFDKVDKLAPAPELSEIEVPEEKNKIDEKIVLAKFYLERKKSRMNSLELLKEILNSEKESDFTTRKTMYQAAKLYGELGMINVQKSIEMDLVEGKWGKCEEVILNRLSEGDKKDLWNKTKEIFNNKTRLNSKNVSSVLFCKN